MPQPIYMVFGTRVDPGLLECFLNHHDPEDVIFPLNYELLQHNQFDDVTLQAPRDANPTKFPIVVWYHSIDLSLTKPRSSLENRNSNLIAYQHCALVSLCSQSYRNDAVNANSQHTSLPPPAMSHY